MILSKSNLFIILALLFGGVLKAQESNFNRFSVEITTGIHIPISPTIGVSRSKYVAFKQFQLAGRYMFSEKYGIKGHYAYNHFNDPNNTTIGIGLNRFGLEGVVNIGRLFNVDYTIREKVGLLFHGGLGLTFAKPIAENSVDHMGNLLLGFTGEIKLNNRFSMLGDVTYVTNLSQQFGYNGIRLDPDNGSQSGSFVNVSIGIMYSLGEKRYHADWY